MRHHSTLTSADLNALTVLRAEWVAAGRPDDHEYTRQIARVQFDGPAMLVRSGRNSYTLTEVEG